MAILCDDCKSFKQTFDPQMSKVLFGHCRAIEYPFLLGDFQGSAARGLHGSQRLQVLPRKEKVG